MPLWLLPLLSALPQLIPAFVQLIDEIINVFKSNPPAPVPAGTLVQLAALRTMLIDLDAENVKRGLRKP